MRPINIPNQSSLANVFQEQDEAGRMKSSACSERLVGVMEALITSPCAPSDPIRMT